MPSTWELLKRLAVPVYGPIALGTIGTGMLIPVLPLYLEDLGLSVGRISFVLAGVGIGSMIGSVPAGELLGRMSERAVMIIALVVLVLATAPLGLTDAVWLLLVMRFVFGSASATLRLSRQTFVARRVDAGERGRAMSFIGGSFRLALLVGPLVGGVLVDAIDYRATFFAAAACNVVGLAFALPARAHSMALLPAAEAEAKVGMLRSVQRHWRKLLLVGPVPVLVMAAREGRYIVLPLIADDLGMSATAVGLLVAISTGADLALFPIAGWIMDRFGRLYAMVPGFSLVAIGLLVLGLAGTPTMVAIAGVIMGVGNGAAAGTMLTIGSDLAPVDSTGPFLAGMAFLQGGGRVIGAAVFGVMASAFDLSGSAIAFAVVLAVAIVWLVSVIGETSTPEGIRAPALR